MRKIIALLLAVMLVVSTLAAPAHACTPRLEIPEVPQVSQVKLKIDFGPDFWAHWFDAHPIDAPKACYVNTWALSNSGQFWD